MKPALLALAATLSIGAVAASAQSLETCAAHRQRGRFNEARACYSRLVGSPDPYIRAEALWALRQYREANDAFRLAVQAQPASPHYRVRWGRLYLDHFQKGDAVKLFQEALEIRKDYAPAILGLALAAAEGFDKKAVELAEEAIKLDPKLVEARELLATLALEDGDTEKAKKQADQALLIDGERLPAMAVLAAIDWLALPDPTPQAPNAWLDRILAINPRYGDAFATAARFLVLNRRYEEGIAFYRKAIELNPELWEAHSELGINLMRLGKDEEARHHLELSFRNGHNSPATVNTLNLLDSYKNFVTYRTSKSVVRLHKKEHELLRAYIEPELLRAIDLYEKKYKVKLSEPVRLEVYPDHEDFAVRALGMPGLGALGVTFGTVVAMDSPSGRKPGSFHWASTLWHELSHVFVLTATKHKVPRWFTEGVAVHEETAIDPEWGDRLSPDIIMALRKKLLLPVAELDRGFIRPSYPGQVIVSYFQAGRICDYIAGKWGFQKLLDMMHSFGQSKSTPEVIREHLGMEPEVFDKEFLAWVTEQTKRSVDGYEDWRKRYRLLVENAKLKMHDEVIREGNAIRDIYPDYVEAGSVYELLADAYLAKGDKKSALAELDRYARAGGRSPERLKQLASLHEEFGNQKEAAKALQRLNYIYPVQDEELHRKLGDLWMQLGNLDSAIVEYQAAVASKPLDPAAAHFRLAQALHKANRREQAEEHLLLALEAAPGYRPAQKMLLELNGKPQPVPIKKREQ